MLAADDSTHGGGREVTVAGGQRHPGDNGGWPRRAAGGWEASGQMTTAEAWPINNDNKLAYY